MKHMDYSIFDSKDDSIAAYLHLMNLFGEFIVFRCKRKRFRHDSELLHHGGPQVANPSLGFAFPPPAATPIVGLAHIHLRGIFDDNFVAFH